MPESLVSQPMTLAIKRLRGFGVGGHHVVPDKSPVCPGHLAYSLGLDRSKVIFRIESKWFSTVFQPKMVAAERKLHATADDGS